jgi:hypothetical protein
MVMVVGTWAFDLADQLGRSDSFAQFSQFGFDGGDISLVIFYFGDDVRWRLQALLGLLNLQMA